MRLALHSANELIFANFVIHGAVYIGSMFDHGNMSRAVCCRLAHGDPDIQQLLPQGYKINHPRLGRVTNCHPPREVQKTKEYSLNWCRFDDSPEVTDGSVGSLLDRLALLCKSIFR